MDAGENILLREKSWAENCSNVLLTGWEIPPTKLDVKDIPQYFSLKIVAFFLWGRGDEFFCTVVTDHISVDGWPCVIQDRRLWQHAELWRLLPALLKDLPQQKHYCATRPNLQAPTFSSLAGAPSNDMQNKFDLFDMSREAFQRSHFRKYPLLSKICY